MVDSSLIPATDAGSFVITRAMLDETGTASMADFSERVQEEALRRALNLRVTRQLDGSLLIEWKPARHPRA